MKNTTLAQQTEDRATSLLRSLDLATFTAKDYVSGLSAGSLVFEQDWDAHRETFKILAIEEMDRRGLSLANSSIKGFKVVTEMRKD